MRRNTRLYLLISLCLVPTLQAAPDTWEELARGVDYRKMSLGAAPLGGEGELHVVRINPDVAKLKLLTSREQGGSGKTASEWSEQSKLSVVINAGMFEMDHSTHTGYLRNGDVVNNPKWVKDYQSIFLLDPRERGDRGALMLDREEVKEDQLAAYRCVAQNLRLMKFNGVGVWVKQERRWSEAALAADAKGNILFLFVRQPYSMFEFTERLKATDLGIVRAAHLEGGPEASLTIQTTKKTLHLCGSHETGFNENENNNHQWSLPNVLGVAADPAP